MMQVLLWIAAVPLGILAVILLIQPWHWPIMSPVLKKSLANRRLFFSEPREESAIPVQRGRKLRKMIIATTTDERRKYFADLAEKYGQDKMIVLPAGESFGFVGWPFFKLDTVQPWFWTEDLEMATDPDTHHSTMPLKVQTVLFPAKLSDALPNQDPKKGTVSKETKSPRAILEERIRLARTGSGSKLSPDEVRLAMGLEHHETADGFPIPFDAELDVEFVDPWLCRNRIQYPGTLIVGLLDAAALQAMASLRVLELDADPDKTASHAVQRSIEPRMLVLLGFAIPTDDMIKDGIKAPDEEHNLVLVLEKYGIKVHRARAKNIQLPETLLEQFRMPVAARAKASSDIIAADAAVKVADRKAQARKKEGEGDRDYLMEVAKGERATVAAYSSDGKTVDAQAVAARLTRGAQSSWQEGVSKAADGKVIVTGSPGTVSPSAEGLVASLAGVASTVAAATKSATPSSKDDQPKDKAKDSASVTPPPDSQLSEDDGGDETE